MLTWEDLKEFVNELSPEQLNEEIIIVDFIGDRSLKIDDVVVTDEKIYITDNDIYTETDINYLDDEEREDAFDSAVEIIQKDQAILQIY